MEPLALRPKEAAKLLQVSPRTLWAWTRQGLLPYVKIGRTVLYPMASLQRWLAERAAQAAASPQAAAEAR